MGSEYSDESSPRPALKRANSGGRFTDAFLSPAGEEIDNEDRDSVLSSEHHNYRTPQLVPLTFNSPITTTISSRIKRENRCIFSRTQLYNFSPRNRLYPVTIKQQLYLMAYMHSCHNESDCVNITVGDDLCSLCYSKFTTWKHKQRIDTIDTLLSHERKLQELKKNILK